MEKPEWELLRRLDRRTRFIVSKMDELEEQGKDVQELKAWAAKIEPDLQELREVLKFRRQAKKVFLWLAAVAVTAAVTTFVNYKTQLYIQQDQRVSTHQREDSKNVSME